MPRPAYSHISDTLFYTQDSPEAVYLSKRDPDLKYIIETLKHVSIDIEGDGFIALARAIIDQQISAHAAFAIWGRLVELCGGHINAETISALDLEEMRAVGVSSRKASYIKDLAAHVMDGSVDFEKLEQMSDEEIISTLTQIKGIGRWTAQMFLVFSLKRPDVFAVDDGGQRRAVIALKGLPPEVPKAVIEDIAAQWAPYRTCASLFLWEWINSKYVKEWQDQY